MGGLLRRIRDLRDDNVKLCARIAELEDKLEDAYTTILAMEDAKEKGER